MGRITIFTIRDCVYCQRAKAFLSSHGLEYVEINVGDFPDRLDVLVTLCGRTSLPQIFFNDEHIGGCSDLLDLDNAGLLPAAIERLAASPGPLLSALEPPSHPPPPPPAPRVAAEEPVFAIGGTVLGQSELAEVLAEADVEDRVYRLRTYRRCVVGSEFTSFLMRRFGLATRADAVEVGRRLVAAGLMAHVCAEHDFEDAFLFYRLQSDSTSAVLNTRRARPAPTSPRPAGEGGAAANALVAALRRELAAAISGHAMPSGLYAYDAVAKSAGMAAFREAVGELQDVRLEAATVEEKVAFYIGVYNMLVDHAHIVLGVPSTALQRNAFFSKVAYIIGGHTLTLNDIEHGILRCNRRPPGGLFRPLSSSRAHLALPPEAFDPRIHFALNCGARSCPPVKDYTPAALRQQLAAAAASFCTDDANVWVDAGGGVAHLSKLFQWYGGDFGEGEREILDAISRFLPPGPKRAAVMGVATLAKPRIAFEFYDWTTKAGSARPFHVD